jgi:beta-glucanase (GH16 family)
MKKWHKILFLVFFWNLVATAQVGPLIWNDEFNNGTLDPAKWSYETGTGVNGDWGTGQLDVATDRAQNVSFQNGIPGADGGCLVITTRKENYQNRTYSSGRLRTFDKASWGPGHRIVARVYPRDVKYQGQGFAFWMMPQEIPTGLDYIMWPQGGELDIMEYVGSIPFHNLGTVHYAWFWENNEYKDWNHGHLGAYYSFQTQQVPIPAEPAYGNYPPTNGDMNAGSADFHTYGMDWYSDRMEFFVDDKVYHIHYFNDGDAYALDGEDKITIQTRNGKRVGVSEYSNHFDEWSPFEHKMYAILSAGVGGSPYTYGGAIVPEALFPCSVFIDWVRVYTLEGALGMDQEMNSPKIIVFPNPTQNILKFQWKNNPAYTYTIYDSNGKKVMKNKLQSTGEIDISSLQKGVYMVCVTTSNFSISKKIIKN